jgi:hypothetical protein
MKKLLQQWTPGCTQFLAAVWIASAAPANDLPDGNAVIRGKAGASEIVITTTSRVAGAIHSLTWNGREFINSFDHGRQLQSASNLDFGSAIHDETFNPTEAGSRRDDIGEKTTSRLLFMRREPSALETVTQMAFWLAPGEKSGGYPAKNTNALSDHLLTKRVQIGYHGMDNVISYNVCFSIPIGEHHTIGTFEALTAYLPPEFALFQQFDQATGDFKPLSDGPGEGKNPVVISLPERTHALGIYAPSLLEKNTTGPSYGRWRFVEQKVVKWNGVFRVRDQSGIKPGEYTFRMFVIVGDLDMVKEGFRALNQEFSGR